MITVATRRQRRLSSSFLVGSCALSAIAQLAVDMPGGYFGAADHLTRFGALYTGLLALIVTALVTALLRGRGTARLAIAGLYCLNVGLFVPPMAADPVIAGIVALWNLILLGRHLLPARPVSRPRRDLRDTPPGHWLEEWYPAVRHLALMALLLSIAVVGYRLSDGLLAWGLCIALGYGVLALAFPLLRGLLHQGGRSAWFCLAPAALGLLFIALPNVMLSLLALALAALLLLLYAQQESAGEVLSDFYSHPSRLIFLSFASIILVGTVLLTFPSAAAPGTSIDALDAFFTAASATCVTGLIVLDTPTAFSPFGQGVILALIQVGGLGIMVLSTFATLLLGGSLGLRGEGALKEMLDLQAGRTAYVLTRFIVLSTLAVEVLGATWLTYAFMSHGSPPLDAVWRGAFHSISAFCNAGFALQSDSVVMFQKDPVTLVVLAGLITVGGLGFVVLAALWSRFVRGSRGRLSVQVRVVLLYSTLLTVVGWGLYALTEWRHTLGGLGTGDRLVNALFQSVTLRTAGFNSVDFATLAAPTLLFMVLFMFVGASPGGTGGGIKTTTVAVLLAAIRATAGGSDAVRLFDREIPRALVYRALAVVGLASVATLGGFFLLLLFESSGQGTDAFERLLFETVSAVGTVGLSLGVTPKLGPVGKFIIIGVMFLGRIGPLTLVLSLGTQRSGQRLRHPQARVMVG